MPAKEIVVDGERVTVVSGARHDLLIFEDGSRESVESVEVWKGDAEPRGERVSWDGVCPMCGSDYDSYTTHLTHCSAGD